MIDGSEVIVGPRDLTKNQMVVMIDKELGGWPTAAASIFQFESADREDTVYHFACSRDMNLGSGPTRRYTVPLWQRRLTRDEYIMYHLSREGKSDLKRQVRDELMKKMGALL